MSRANERTFQGILNVVINRVIAEQPELKFSSFHVEENIGTKNDSKFADGLLKGANDTTILFELKNASWDATDIELVTHSAQKATLNGYEYFVTGTPRTLALFKTFEAGKTLAERKVKIFPLVPVRDDQDVTRPDFEKRLYTLVTDFLKELSAILFGKKTIIWDSFDKLFVYKLASFITESAERMTEGMYHIIQSDTSLKQRLESYIENQDIFKINTTFDLEDVRHICFLANYLLYLKIIFYTYLQRDVPALGLRPLKIPDDARLLTPTLRIYFDDVLKHDYEKIFEPSVMDEFQYPNAYIETLNKHVQEIHHLNFSDLNVDVMGAIYNTLIDNQEQHDRGQHFTNPFEVDIVNAFCIRADTEKMIDTGCGAGTFLVRAYFFLKHFHPELTHQQLLTRLWGVEIAPFPAFLATMNLALLDVANLDNYPAIIQKDFVQVEKNKPVTIINPTPLTELAEVTGKKQTLSMPVFDACIGNPPYIRQELIKNKDLWLKRILTEFDDIKEKDIDGKSDLYLYFLIHTASLLKEGGRLGYVISASWLDVQFGTVLQKFLLDHFKIIAVIDQQKVRSFETASVNTIILIAEKCTDKTQRQQNDVAFVRIRAEYEQFIGAIDQPERIPQVQAFAQLIEQPAENLPDYLQIQRINQKVLEQRSLTDGGTYTNGNWGATFLRAPEIYFKILQKAKDFLIPLHKIADVRYGIKSGNNDFFYVEDLTEKALNMSRENYELQFGVSRMGKGGINWEKYGWYYSDLTKTPYIMEREFFVPLYKTQSEAENLSVKPDKLKFSVLMCSEPKEHLENTRLIKYISDAEAKGIHSAPTLKSRAIWYNLKPSAFIGDFIFPSKIGEYYRLADNRTAKVLCDKVNYAIKVKPAYDKDLLFAVLNSTLFRFLIDLFARQMVVKVSDVDVYVVNNTLIPQPEVLAPYATELKKAMETLGKREQMSIFEETLQADRKALDVLIFKALGLDESDLETLYTEARNYVKERASKSDSLSTTKTRKKADEATVLRVIRAKFNDTVRGYAVLTQKQAVRAVYIPEGKIKIPKKLLEQGSGGLFEAIEAHFPESGKKIVFDSIEQLRLFEYIYTTLGFQIGTLELPTNQLACMEVLKALKHDLNENKELITATLKSLSAKVSFKTVYKTLILGAD